MVGINGLDGKQRGATNRIETANEKWLSWTFDHPDTQTKYLTEYEGISGSGDSGGPAFILKNDTVYLAGISSWQDTRDGDEGLYGVIENYTRISKHVTWIQKEISGIHTNSAETIRVGPKPNASVYKPTAININTSSLNRYIGEYGIEDTTVKIYTKDDDTNLYLYVSGYPEYAFIPTAKDVFLSKITEGSKLEFKNEENDIFKKLTITLSGISYTAIRK